MGTQGPSGPQYSMDHALHLRACRQNLDPIHISRRFDYCSSRSWIPHVPASLKKTNSTVKHWCYLPESYRPSFLLPFPPSLLSSCLASSKISMMDKIRLMLLVQMVKLVTWRQLISAFRPQFQPPQWTGKPNWQETQICYWSQQSTITKDLIKDFLGPGFFFIFFSFSKWKIDSINKYWSKTFQNIPFQSINGFIQIYISQILEKKNKKRRGGFIIFALYGNTSNTNIPTFSWAKIWTRQKHILTVS